MAKKQGKHTKKAKRSTSTALARRSVRSVMRQRVEMMPAPEPERISVIALGAFPFVPTPEQKKVLERPVVVDHVEVKPTRSGAVYLSHIRYTRWLNDAFGIGGWVLVKKPGSEPRRTGNLVTQDYFLFIGGRPVAEATGEQEWHEDNKDQSWGDALESTYANALRRCCKHLGMSLELWDRRWTRRFLSEECVRVEVEGQGKVWRRKDDPPLPKENRGGSSRRERPREDRNAPTMHAAAEETITDAQRKRLVAIVRNSGRNEAEVATWIREYFRVPDSSGIRRKDYDFACRAIEDPGPLPSRRSS